MATRFFCLILTAILLALTGVAPAQEKKKIPPDQICIVLTNGTRVYGKLVAILNKEIHIESRGEVIRLNVDNIDSIHFGRLPADEKRGKDARMKYPLQEVPTVVVLFLRESDLFLAKVDQDLRQADELYRRATFLPACFALVVKYDPKRAEELTKWLQQRYGKYDKPWKEQLLRICGIAVLTRKGDKQKAQELYEEFKKLPDKDPSLERLAESARKPGFGDGVEEGLRELEEVVRDRMGAAVRKKADEKESRVTAPAEDVAKDYARLARKNVSAAELLPTLQALGEACRQNPRGMFSVGRVLHPGEILSEENDRVKALLAVGFIYAADSAGRPSVSDNMKNELGQVLRDDPKLKEDLRPLLKLLPPPPGDRPRHEHDRPPFGPRRRRGPSPAGAP